MIREKEACKLAFLSAQLYFFIIPTVLLYIHKIKYYKGVLNFVCYLISVMLLDDTSIQFIEKHGEMTFYFRERIIVQFDHISNINVI